MKKILSILSILFLGSMLFAEPAVVGLTDSDVSNFIKNYSTIQSSVNSETTEAQLDAILSKNGISGNNRIEKYSIIGQGMAVVAAEAEMDSETLAMLDAFGVNPLKTLIDKINSKDLTVIRKYSKQLIALANEEERITKLKALELFDTNKINEFEIGTFKGLSNIHSYLFGDIYSFAGKIRKENIAKGNFRFVPTEYIEDSEGEVTFCITSVDWKLITQQYDVTDLTWHGGYMFRANPFQFKEYVGKWTEVKNNATIEGNAGKRQIAKLMLNSLYGKFATRTTVKSRKPVLIDDVVKYIDLEPTERDPVYLPVGVFITSYARYKTISSAQAVYDRFIYADTDSLHLIGTEIPETLDVDSVKLGAWKHESTFTRAKFLRPKTYVEEIDGELVVHCAGMPARCHKNVTLENFKPGAVYEGKLYTKRVPGGIVLVEGDMEIRE